MELVGIDATKENRALVGLQIIEVETKGRHGDDFLRHHVFDDGRILDCSRLVCLESQAHKARSTDRLQGQAHLLAFDSGVVDGDGVFEVSALDVTAIKIGDVEELSG